MRTKVAPFDERARFILEWARLEPVSVMHQKFSDAYIDFSGASFVPSQFGACICSLLGRDLSRLHKNGELSRWIVGLHAQGPGFPKWVYVYEINQPETKP